VRNRNEETAEQILSRTAIGSKSQENAEAYKTFQSIPRIQRLALLKSISILDGSPNIIDLYEEICREVRHAVSRTHIDRFVERLEGWWFGLIVKILAGSDGASIPVIAIDNRLDELREEFRRSSLPIDYADKTPPPSIIADLDRRPFVRQLRRIEIGSARIEYAIRDYYRASEQRSKWAREELLGDGELGSYERELVEAWEPRYAAMLEDLAPASQKADHVLAGQSLYKWAETEAIFPLRSIRQRFLTHGSFHILSNRHAVGWHPEYKALANSDADETEKD
jgi:hypothetical protein